jgi:hypothetical protein
MLARFSVASTKPERARRRAKAGCLGEKAGVVWRRVIAGEK